jgi:hypothetical protein
MAKTNEKEWEDFQTPVRLMNKENQFKFEITAPKPTSMTIKKDKIVFEGDSKKQDNSVMNQRSKLEIKKEQIKGIKFNKIFNSAIKIKYVEKGEEKIAYIQYMANSKMPYLLKGTQIIYKNLQNYLKGEPLEYIGIPRWLHIVAVFIIILGMVLGGIIGFFVALLLNALLYKFIPKILKK